MLKDVVLDVDNYLAHRGNKIYDETLVEHSDLVMSYYRRLSSENRIDDILNTLIYELFNDRLDIDDSVVEFIKYLFEQAIYLHDIGKINSNFQNNQMDNKKFNKVRGMDDNHSLMSSLFYIYLMDIEIERTFDDEEKVGAMRNIVYHFAFIISKHHSSLFGFGDFFDKVVELRDKLLKYPLAVYGFMEYDKFSRYELFDILDDTENVRFIDMFENRKLWMLNKLLFSSIVTSDFMATYYYFNQCDPYIDYLDGDRVVRMKNEFENFGVVQGIREYSKSGKVPGGVEINKLRSEMFLEAERNVLRNHSDVYYLEAPTGSGKTLTSVNLAMNILEKDSSLNKLIYVFPFNTLSDQTKTVLDSIFEESGEEFVVINSTSSVFGYKENNETGYNMSDYNEMVLRQQTSQYACSITSHVNLFNRIFGISRDTNLSFLNLCNSVIILDEIQSFRNEIWEEIISFINDFSRIFNMKFVIMSATLPRLSEIFHISNNHCNLIENREMYFSNELFRDRVKLDFSMLNIDYGNGEIYNVVDDFLTVYEKHGQVKYLIEFINRGSARSFYNTLRDRLHDVEIIEITGDDSSYVRRKYIERIKSSDHIIVVSTQVIEAGVDISMDVGLKDVSLLDSEEQFLGRINRSCEGVGYAYFFNFDNAIGIYRNDVRATKGIETGKDIQQMLIDKDFSKFYEYVADKLVKKRGDRSKTKNYSLTKTLDSFDYVGVFKHMKLIDNSSVQVVFNFTTDVDGVVYNGRDVWEEYKYVRENKKLSFSEKKVRLREVRKIMSNFTFNIITKGDEFSGDYTEEYDRMLYVEDGEYYMMDVDGVKKFDRNKYLGNSAG